MAMMGRQIRPGGWLDVPGVGTGRIARIYAVPGTARYRVTLESGVQLDVAWDAPILFWEH